MFCDLLIVVNQSNETVSLSKHHKPWSPFANFPMVMASDDMLKKLLWVVE